MPAGDPVSTQRFEDYMRAHAREHELAGHVMKEAKEVVDAKLAHLNNLRQDFVTKDEHKALSLQVTSLENSRINSTAEARVWAIVAGTIVSVVIQIVFWYLK